MSNCLILEIFVSPNASGGILKIVTTLKKESFIIEYIFLHFMSQVQASTSAGEQKLDAVEHILHRMLGHADTFKGFLDEVLSLSPADWQNPEVLRVVAAGLSRVPRKLDTEIEDLTTIVQQMGKVRELATQRGYTDVLELLDQKLPYDRNY